MWHVAVVLMNLQSYVGEQLARQQLVETLLQMPAERRSLERNNLIYGLSSVHTALTEVEISCLRTDDPSGIARHPWGASAIGRAWSKNAVMALCNCQRQTC